MSTDETRPELRLSSHVLIQLGSELVTDVEQAILECVKNAYDADSFGCTIRIDTCETGTLTQRDRADRLARFIGEAENVQASVTPVPEDGGSPGEDGAPVAMVERRLDYRGVITVEDSGAASLRNSSGRRGWSSVAPAKGPKAARRRGHPRAAPRWVTRASDGSGPCVSATS